MKTRCTEAKNVIPRFGMGSPRTASIGQSRVMESDHLALIRSGRDDQPRLDRQADLVRVRHGVYADAEAWAKLPGWERYHHRIEAFRMVCTDGALSHDSAAIAHGLPTFGEPRKIHLFGAGGVRGWTASDVTRHSSTDEREIVETELGPATSLRDTAIDLGRTLHPAFALAVWDAVLKRGITREDLAQRWREQSSTRGVRTLDWLTSRATEASESPGESVSRALIEWLGIEEPELQRGVSTPEGDRRVDYLWRMKRTIGEFDGYAKYALGAGSTFDALKQEKRREDALRRMGYTVIRWEQRDLADPKKLLEILRAGGLMPIRPPQQTLLNSYVVATAKLTSR